MTMFRFTTPRWCQCPQPVLSDIDLTIRPGKRLPWSARPGRQDDARETAGALPRPDRRPHPRRRPRPQDHYAGKSPEADGYRAAGAVPVQRIVKENILFGRLDAGDEEVVAAAEAVGATGFIVNLKEGYQTLVEEGGVMLSVGQRQLISFAAPFWRTRGSSSSTRPRRRWTRKPSRSSSGHWHGCSRGGRRSSLPSLVNDHRCG